ncbi:MAG: hypothetical protein F6K50_09125 [Moorea sp. SIO3I7]|uniref:hypothetical protein n=1 Tax=unclassified Moorena TaxID=2683338 RepID=UPI0013C21AEE|nr:MULTISPECIES: hypothetical protein [unclassified Moorena]NEN95683.1 hypothetical protein [Moorena sp. SIO3I7]NEO10055.1 hypothetical protein [Moorena sp. SIO3I8]NEP22497.1 hypothetical protein [Moorena sp. SIO3I6]
MAKRPRYANNLPPKLILPHKILPIPDAIAIRILSSHLVRTIRNILPPKLLSPEEAAKLVRTMEPNQVMLMKALHPLKHLRIFLDLFHLLDKV